MMFDYVDEAEKKLNALKIRKANIQKVTNKDLIEIKEKVIAYLDKGIKDTQLIVDNEKKQTK